MHRSLPVYSGGLGALAGDILKEASDRALPLVAVGLMYRQGYFRQRIDAGGWQHEYWVDTDPERLPAALVTGADGSPVTITVPVRGLEVTAQVWRVDVGRVPLFLLDTERPENDIARELDHVAAVHRRRPTPGSPSTSCSASAACARCEAMGIDPAIAAPQRGARGVHLARGRTRPRRRSLERRPRRRRAETVFTTHTPVPAGNDTYPADQVVEALAGLTASMGVDPAEVIRLGRTRPDDDGEPFGVSQFALRTSRAANGVSRRHGEVARGMWRDLWPDRAVEEVPIGHVTNGVHVPTWLGGPMRALLDRHLGDGWIDHAADPATWAGIDAIPDEELWAVRREQRSALVDYVRIKSVADRLGRDEPRGYVEAAAGSFDPDALTVGFARRLATYKRLHLLVQDADRALALLGNGRPVQLVMAGKAHPRDDDGKRMVKHLFTFKWAPEIGGRVVYLDDYDLSSAARMVRGCDVWLNLPAPAAGGERHERDEVGGQRRPPAQRARRLVGGGLRRRERLGAAR